MLAAMLVVLLALAAWPVASPAHHVGIEAYIGARVVERPYPNTWVVEITYTINCLGAADPLLYGYFSVFNPDTGDRTPWEQIFNSPRTVQKSFTAGEREQRIVAELDKVSCADHVGGHRSGVTRATSEIVVIPRRFGGGGGSGGGGGGSSGDPTEPLGPRGCFRVLQGTGGHDALSGSTGGDVIFGYAGDDRIRGGGGHDCLLGGPGKDVLRGDQGHDRLTGEGGDDTLVGGSGVDAYDAGPGNDFVNAANGRPETVNCGPGQDRAHVDRSDRLLGCERVTRRG